MTSGRALLLVLDGCGAGFTPDYLEYGDIEPGNTIKNVWNANNGLNLPHLTKVGFLNACGVDTKAEFSYAGKLYPLSRGKDSATGHWEMMGITTTVPYPTYPDGFPDELLRLIEKKFGIKFLCNQPISGTDAIFRYGKNHIVSKDLILYTSADSVLQIAAHEDVIPVEKLYEICRYAREICMHPHLIQRIIARPFITDSEGNFVRTTNRKDFPAKAPHNFIDEYAKNTQEMVYGIGVVPELFNHRGFIHIERTQSNNDHYEKLLEALDSSHRFIFANFEDFDMLYGHRNDPIGFGRCLEEFDQMLGSILDKLTNEDILILTADHGNDPTTKGTDHSREYVPFVLYNENILYSDIGTKFGLGLIAKTIGNYFNSGKIVIP